MHEYLRPYAYELIWFGLALAGGCWLVSKFAEAEVGNWLHGNDPTFVDETDTANKASLASQYRQVPLAPFFVGFYICFTDTARYARLRAARSQGHLLATVWRTAKFLVPIGSIVMATGFYLYASYHRH